MRSVRLRQSLAVAVALSLTLLIAGVVGLGVAMWHGDVVPPDLDVSLGRLHIVAHVIDPNACRLALRIALPCPGPLQDYYVVWVFYKTTPDYLSVNGGRVLLVPLKR
jgi:hypothetical protein